MSTTQMHVDSEKKIPIFIFEKHSSQQDMQKQFMSMQT
jgi:hypothetical protein